MTVPFPPVSGLIRTLSPGPRGEAGPGAPLPLVETYQPKVVVPCHHDDLYPVFIDMATEPLKMRVHEELPAASTVQPVYVEPVTIGLTTGVITQGDG